MTRAPETKGYLKITVNKQECSCGLRKKIKTEIAFYKNYPLRDSTMCDADIIRALEDLLK